MSTSLIVGFPQYPRRRSIDMNHVEAQHALVNLPINGLASSADEHQQKQYLIKRFAELDCALIVDWPAKDMAGVVGNDEKSRRQCPKRLDFSLERNTTHEYYKSEIEIKESWDKSRNKKVYKEGSLRDAKFFRHLVKNNKEPESFGADWDEHFCAWGIEHIISRTAAPKMMERQELNRKIVREMQGNVGNGERSESMAKALASVSKAAVDRSRKLGELYAQECRSLYEIEN